LRAKILIKISDEHFITGRLETIENTVTPIIKQLNSTGLPIDIRVVERIRNQYLDLQKECAEIIYSLVGYKFELGKRDQIETAFKKEGFKIGKSANALVMDRLSREGSNLAALIKKYRQLQRVSSNGQSLINYYDEFSRKLRPIWHQNKALTGRILSEAPCVSNISKQYRAAVREDGYKFIFFDFRNFELRIQASLANDPILTEMFNKNFDLHAFTASLILNKEPAEITPDERKKYKSISLGFWYGMGVEGIVYRTGLQKRFVRTVTDKLDQKFQVLRSRVTDFKAKYGFWALLAQASAGDYFKFILVQIAEKLPELILSAPLFDGCLYKIKNDQQKIESLIGDINEVVSQQVEGFCKMSIDIGSGKSWQGAVQNTVATDTQ
jgi:DNA polymerase-1